MKVDLFVLCMKCTDPEKGNTHIEMKSVESIDSNIEVVECPKCEHRVALRADPRSGFGYIDEIAESGTARPWEQSGYGLVDVPSGKFAAPNAETGRYPKPNNEQ